jgi:hypothetical protein
VQRSEEGNDVLQCNVSSSGIALQRSVAKKATAATLPSPSFSFYNGRKLDFKNKLSFVVVAFFFSPCSIAKKVTALSFFATERRKR